VESNRNDHHEWFSRASPGESPPPHSGASGRARQDLGPVSGTISTCEQTEYEATGRTLKWRLQCRGQLDVDVAGQFNFDTPLHYTATITSKGRMAGALISDVKTELEGERMATVSSDGAMVRAT